MARLRPIKTNFTNGEVDPLITMRSDLELFVNGASKMRNALPFPQGGFRRRDGLEFMTKIPPTGFTTPIGICPTDVFGDNRIEIVTAGANYSIGDIVGVSGGTGISATLEVATVNLLGGITGIFVRTAGDYTVAPSSPASVTAVGGGEGAVIAFSSEGQGVVLPIDFTFSVDQNYLIVFTVSRFYIFRKENTGTGPNQLVFNGRHPYCNEDLKTITWTQSFDVMLIAHKDHPILQLTRLGETVWTFEPFEISNIPGFAFGERPDSDLTVNLGNDFQPGDVINMDSGSGTWPTTSVGSYIRVFASADADGLDRASYYKITAFVNTSRVRAEILVAPIWTQNNMEVKAGFWLLEEPVWSYDRGYPRCLTFFQGRLCCAGSKDRPNGFWASRAGDITDFNNGGTDDDFGIALTADTGDVVTFQNIYPGRHLQLFADSSEFYIPISESEPMTPTTASLRRTTSVGSKSGVSVFEVDGVDYFVQRGGRSVRQFVFVDGEKAYSADIVSLFSSHLIRNPSGASFKKSLNTEDGNYIWLQNEDGSLAAFALLRSELINAWSLHTTKGEFVRSAVLDQTTYFHIKRNVGESNVEYTGEFANVRQGNADQLRDFAFSPDGKTMFVLDGLFRIIYQYDLELAYDFNTITYSGNSFDVSDDIAFPTTISLSPAGDRLFVSGLVPQDVLQYNMSGAFDVSTAVFNQSHSIMETNFVIGMGWSRDGKKLYLIDQSEKMIFEYDVTVAWDVGTIEYTGNSLDVVSEETAPRSVEVSLDGNRIFIIAGNRSSLLQYNMTTAFDLSTASFTGFEYVFDQDSAPRTFRFSTDGTLGFMGGQINTEVYKFTFSRPFSISPGEKIDTIEFFNPNLKFDSGEISTTLQAPVSVVGGVVHLEGETVQIIVDQIFVGEGIVNNGELILPVEAQNSYQFGIPFPNIIDEDSGEDTGFNVLVRTLPADVLLPEGSKMGKKKRVPTCTVRFIDTQGFYLQGVQVPFRNLPFVLDVPIPMQSGDKELKGLLGWDDFGQIDVGQKEPLAMTILGMAYDLSTG